MPEERLCECGCGQPCWKGYRVARGHSRHTSYYTPSARPKHTKHKPPKPAKKERSCLRCNRTFVSEGAHVRLCGGCRVFLNTEPTPATVAHLGPSGAGTLFSLWRG